MIEPDKLREYRIKACGTQSFAACRVGVTETTWQRWETGTHRPHPKYWHKITQVLNCEIKDLRK